MWGRGRGRRGRPRSANGASSFHLWWQLPPCSPLVEVGATLEVVKAPEVQALHFWALQVSFTDRGRRLGGAHTGLQWHPAAPAGALNWGGYGPTGAELAGTESPLPMVDSVNTRRWPWAPGRPYRLRVWSPEPGAWRSEVTDGVDGRSVAVRDLLVDAPHLAEPVVWAEVFAPCDAPPTAARWSGLEAVDAHGAVVRPGAVAVSFQAVAAGGCVTTDVVADGDGVVQLTGLTRPRQAGDGSLLRLTPPRPGPSGPTVPT